MAAVLTLDNPLLKGMPPAIRRDPQDKGDVRLPADLKIVSADGHWEVTEDIFFERFPDAMKEKAPRIWFDDYWHMGYPGPAPSEPAAIALEERLKQVMSVVCAPGTWDLDMRMADLDAEGIDREIVYPNSMLGFVRHPDLEVQEQVYRIYNERLAEIQNQYPGRFFGVGICSNWWDPSRARAAIRQIVDLGLKTFMVPTSNPGKTSDGRAISYGGEEMDIFWDEVAAAGLPLCFHVGENFSILGRGSMGATVVQSIGPFRKPFAELVFGGVFDRHPGLQIVFAEGGISWVPVALQDCEAVYDAHYEVLDIRPAHRPSHYWHNNCYATFQNDLLGLKMLDYIGVDRVMWANDYPHNEGAFGYSWSSMQSVLDAVSIDDARKILGDTATRLYRLDE